MAKNNLQIIFEDDDIVAVNKPAGLLSIPDRAQSELSLKEMLLKKYGSIFTIHRLDKDTSGLILFAKNERAHKYFSLLFEERRIEKYYTGIVTGSPVNREGIIDAPITEHLHHKGLMTIHRNGKPSQTGYEVLESNRHYSIVSFRLFTGRTHQIRVHAKHIGHPLACDPLYGDGKPVLLSTIKKKYRLSKHDETERPVIASLALHSYKLIFESQEGKQLTLTAEIPKSFRVLMIQINKNNTESSSA